MLYFIIPSAQALFSAKITSVCTEMYSYYSDPPSRLCSGARGARERWWCLRTSCPSFWPLLAITPPRTLRLSALWAESSPTIGELLLPIAEVLRDVPYIVIWSLDFRSCWQLFGSGSAINYCLDPYHYCWNLDPDAGQRW
jgi:hypothetical protein